MGSRLLSLLAFSAALFANEGVTAAEFLPKVDLGYQVNKASSLTDDAIYTFKNIRYAAAPVGKLRFKPPTCPEKDRSQVIDGANIPVTNCIQGAPNWGGSNDTDPLDNIGLPHGTEDCLFLDVLAPRDVLSGANKSVKTRGQRSKGSPVVVWIHGGGWVQGSKEWYGGLQGLIEASGNNTIVVQINYRLGALGFVSGPSFRASGGIPNVGLLDQRFALEWVQKHIHLFGGDPDEVTVMGQSAGGGSVVHQITAYGGAKKSPFKRAISFSPGFQPTPSHFMAETQYNQFAVAAGCTTNTTLITGMGDDVMECLMGKTSEELLRANQAVIASKDTGIWGFGPTIDGTFAPDLPGNLLLYGMYDKDVQLMTGQVADEAHDYTDPKFNKTDSIGGLIDYALPYSDPDVKDYIENELYPTTSDNTSDRYTDNFHRADLMISEFGFTCNNVYLHNAYKGNSYGYEMSIPPAYHAYDMVYVFNINTTETPEAMFANMTVTHAVRFWVSNFIATGDPNKVDPGNKAVWAGMSWPEFPKYGNESTIMGIDDGMLAPRKSPSANERCKWFQKGLYIN